ncbi:transposase, partial [Candidatus Uhrbacteria bacterium]|nr:transposase [Candidatus Uhrbacteria bacterium]MBI4598575.1 transposase [Candidatus Uhrbacteria bacterium]MBI4598950.1 transposase [Candidatus Uhrbacteria bacterium]MBI4599044.1 transposase [Candidatus Uhrbacteria bacterium]
VTEGLNAKIQYVKASARGFRSFAHYRIAILFYCGKLDMQPL